MFYDAETNVVCIAEALQRYPEIYAKLVGSLADHGIKIVLVKNTRNVWVRDYLPIQVNDHYVKFRYKGDEKYAVLDVSAAEWDVFLPILHSEITLDGGNVVRYGNRAIVTDIIYRHNPGFKKKELLGKLEQLLEAQVIVIPREPFDPLGHADGMIKFINESSVLINDYGDTKFATKLKKVINKNGLWFVLFPLDYEKRPKMTEKEFRKKYPDADEKNEGWGYYINILEVKGLILCPQFGIEDDKKVITMLKKYFYNSDVMGIECGDLSMTGGLVNCITMSYKDSTL